jgi:hypothetical protein
VKSTPFNGGSFNGAGQMQFRLPNNMNNTYLSCENMYLKLPLVNSSSGAANLDVKTGAASLISKLELVIDGQTAIIEDNYAELIAAYVDIEATNDFANNQGRVMLGAGTALNASAGGASTTLTFCVPLYGSFLQSVQHYFPLCSRSNVEIRITLNAWNFCFVSAGATAIANSEITISNPELVMYMVEISENAQSLIARNCNNDYKLFGKTYRSTQATLAQNITSSNILLPFSVSSLETVYCCFYLASTHTNDNTVYAPSSRVNPGIDQIDVNLNGKILPARKIYGTSSEVLAELSIRNRTLPSFMSSVINAGTADMFASTGPAATSLATCGTYLVCIDLESMLPRLGDEGSMFSGQDTRGGILTLEITFSAGLSAAMHCIVYGINTVEFDLNMNAGATQTWSVSV